MLDRWPANAVAAAFAECLETRYPWLRHTWAPVAVCPRACEVLASYDVPASAPWWVAGSYTWARVQGVPGVVREGCPVQTWAWLDCVPYPLWVGPDERVAYHADAPREGWACATPGALLRGRAARHRTWGAWARAACEDRGGSHVWVP